MTIRRILAVMCMATGLSLAALPVAQAGPGDAVAAGNAGSAKVGQTTVAPIAPCTTEGTLQATKADTTVPNVVSYSGSKSVCTIDSNGEIATVTVTGGRFRFDALLAYGGPRIRLATYTAKCKTTLDGSTSGLQFSGLSGVSLPAQIPANYVVTIPGQGSSKPMATVTFNELIVPSPSNGSMTVNLMHIRMFPKGGPTTGDAYVGTVHCSSVS